MTLTQMNYIVALAQCLNFSEASQLLHITQPTLSKQISIIEDEVGFPLFIRNNKSTQITDTGRLFCDGIIKILKDYDHLLDTSRQKSRAERKNLAIGITEFRTICADVRRAIQALKKDGYSIEIISRSLSELEQLQIQGRIDVLLRPVAKNMEVAPDYNALFLYDIHNCLVVPRELVPLDRAPQIEDYADQEILIIGDQMPTYEENVRKSFQGIKKRPKFVYVEKFSDLVVMLSSKLGISVLPEDHYLSNSPELCFLKMPEIVSTSMCAVWKKSIVNPTINEFVRRI